MTGAPPPEMPPPQVPPRDELGFLACGAIVFGSLIALSTVIGAIAAAVPDAPWVPATAGGVALVAAVFYAIRDRRFARCLFKGLATALAFSVVIFGVCLAILTATFN